MKRTDPLHTILSSTRKETIGSTLNGKILVQKNNPTTVEIWAMPVTFSTPCTLKSHCDYTELLIFLKAVCLLPETSFHTFLRAGKQESGFEGILLRESLYYSVESPIDLHAAKLSWMMSEVLRS